MWVKIKQTLGFLCSVPKAGVAMEMDGDAVHCLRMDGLSFPAPLAPGLWAGEHKAVSWVLQGWKGMCARSGLEGRLGNITGILTLPLPTLSLLILFWHILLSCLFSFPISTSPPVSPPSSLLLSSHSKHSLEI